MCRVGVVCMQFVLYGSVMAFYVPLVIMFATYALSVRILRRNHQLMKLIALGSVTPEYSRVVRGLG